MSRRGRRLPVAPMLKEAAAAFPSCRAIAAFPSRRAVVVKGRLELTHFTLDVLVNAAAAHLTAYAEVRHGHVVALYFPSTVAQLVVMFLAVIRAHAVAAPLNPASTRWRRLAHLLITNPKGNAAAQAAAAKLGLVCPIATLKDAAGPIHLAGLPDVNADGSSTVEGNGPIQIQI